MKQPHLSQFFREKKPKKLVLLYHWDADGLASAALILNFIAKHSPKTRVVLMHPSINHYFLKESEYQRIRRVKSEMIITVDLNFFVEVIKRLEQISPTVFVFDHHAQTEHIQRPGMQNPQYPGCSLLIADYLEEPHSLTSIIGAVRDQAERLIEDKKFFPCVQSIMKTQQLSFQHLLKLAKFIDAAFIVKDEKGMKDAIQLLRIDPQKSLTHKRLLQCNQRIQKELNKLQKQPMDHIADRIYYQFFSSSFNITSEIGRLKSAQYPKHIVVIEQRRGKETSIYVRRWKYDLHLGKIVDFARSEGYISGGKSEVAGIVLPTRQAKVFRESLLSYLQELTHS